MTKYMFLLLLFGLQSLYVAAGSFRSLSVKEGLSSRQAFQINKDSAGFVWVYTHLGVDRYDGNEIRHYPVDNTVESRSHILSSTVLTCDQPGNSWIAMKNGKIYAYDRQTDAFVLRINLSDYLVAPVLYHILFDADNRLWICTSAGIYSWNAETQLSVAGLEGCRVNCLIQANDKSFFAGTDKGVYLLTKNTAASSFSARRLPLPVETHVTSLYGWDDKLFIGTFSDGVFVFDRFAEKAHPLGAFVPHVPVRAFAKAKNNTLLIGADGAGMLRINPATEKLLNQYTADADDDRSLNGNTVSDICVDGHGRIWVSTSTNGVSYLDPDMPDIRRIGHERNNVNSLKSDHVNVIFQDSEGDCWYGTNNGVSLYRPGSDKWTHYLDGTGHSGKVILALAEDGSGNIWAGGYGTGMYCIQKKTGRVRKLEKRNARSGKGVASDYIYAIYAEGDTLWFGGIEGEFTRYVLHADSYTYYPLHCIGDIKSGKDGSLLMAGCDGLAVFDKTTGRAQWHRQFGDFTLHYPIRCLLQSSGGDIWMATDGEGLIRFAPDKNDVHVYTTAHGLESNSINSVLEDHHGRIWFSTEKELYCLDLTKNCPVNAHDFLHISQGYYNPAAAFGLADGRLAFGTAEGAVVFFPPSDWGRHGPAELIFTDFKLLYESVKAGMKGSLLTTPIDDTRQVCLNYNQHSFSLSFSAIDFTAPHRIRYAYRLGNYDRQWRYSGSVRSVSYMNLSPGKYLFRLRAFDKYTGQQIGERELEIVICPPCWMSWWALLVYFAVLSVFVYLFIQNRRHKASEDRIKEKIRCFISIAHDILTPVTLIKAPLSELETQPELPEKSRKNVAVAVKNAEKLLTMINRLLDLQKTELYAEQPLKVSLCDIKSYLEEKIAAFHLAAVQKSVDLQLEVEPHMPAVWIDREKMNHIVDNLLSNALKYTEKGTVCIEVKTTKKQWSVEVRDTGIGIPEEEQRYIFHTYYRAQNAMNLAETGFGIGLAITRHIVKQHHGTISFRSAEGKGTAFTVTFPRKIKADVVVKPEEDNREMPVTVDAIRTEAENAGKNILLLAEDDPDMREYLTNSLSPEYKVIGVPDGGKALEAAREINPDIIVSDVVMPVLGGNELCRLLKSSVDTSHVPVILLTALSERENIIFGLEAGANDYIVKPFDLSVLKARIRNILQNRQHLRETVLSMDTSPEETDYTSQLDKEFLDKAMEAVHTRLSDSEFSIRDFCRMLGMSRTSVYNKIKTLTGQGPNDFIRIVRLNKAKELLATRRYTIGEVATMVGFSDPKYFSTCFKKQFGVSPSKI